MSASHSTTPPAIFPEHVRSVAIVLAPNKEIPLWFHDFLDLIPPSITLLPCLTVAWSDCVSSQQLLIGRGHPHFLVGPDYRNAGPIRNPEDYGLACARNALLNADGLIAASKGTDRAVSWAIVKAFHLGKPFIAFSHLGHITGAHLTNTPPGHRLQPGELLARPSHARKASLPRSPASGPRGPSSLPPPPMDEGNRTPSTETVATPDAPANAE